MEVDRNVTDSRLAEANESAQIKVPKMPDDFFVTGGSMAYDAPSYVTRPADKDLLRRVLASQYCYVLTPRQMGKSSLMIRSEQRLQKRGSKTVIIDLQRIGISGVTIDLWYQSILNEIAKKLKLSVVPKKWWNQHSESTPTQCFIDYLRDVVLTEVTAQIVIFIDEIDITLHFKFRDDFFSAIRSMYNARATDPVFRRLTFVLLGVVFPADLIKNRRTSPFNIGYGIDLQELSPINAAGVLLAGLEKFHPGQGVIIFNRIYYWTNGHPYLTQRLCLAAASEKNGAWTEERIDDLVERLFFSGEVSEETHLEFIEKQILDQKRQRQLLKLYKRVYRGEVVSDEKQSILHNQLKLSSLVTARNGQLHVRNEIYRKVFDADWIKENLPFYLEHLEHFIAIIVVVAFMLSAFLVWQGRQQQQPDEVLALAYTNDFNSTANPILRLNSLANLFGLRGEYGDRARPLFDSLTFDEKIALFANVTPDLEPQVKAVVRGTYTELEDTEANNRLLQAMQSALEQFEEPDSVNLASEIALWSNGRAAAAEENYTVAKFAYDAAIRLNHKNPSTHFERSLVLAALGDCEGALADLNDALSLAEDWQDRVEQAIEGNICLYEAWQRTREAHPALIALLPTPTSTSATISTPTLAVTSTFTPPTNTPTPTATNTPTNTPIFTPIPTDTPTPTPVPPFLAIQTPGGHYLTAVDGGNKPPGAAIRADVTEIGSFEKFKLIDLGGDEYAIQTASGHYLTAVDGGGRTNQALRTDVPEIGDWEKFKLTDLGEDRYAIQTYSGYYLTAIDDGDEVPHSPFRTNATEISGWEEFELFPIDERKGVYVIRTNSGHYLRAVDVGNGRTYTINTDGSGHSNLDKFTLIELGGGEYAIQTPFGYYLTAVDGGNRRTGAIRADVTEIGPFEKFKLTDLGSKKYTIQTADGHYLTAVDGGNRRSSYIWANATGIGPSEVFRLIPTR